MLSLLNTLGKQKKTLSANGLLAIVKDVFNRVPVIKKSHKGKKATISMTDCLMSALAMFNLKSPSLLSFDKGRMSKTIENNLKKLFGIKKVPSDTYMREKLDEVNPELIRTCFTKIFEAIQRGKLLEKYLFMDSYLLLIDGSDVYKSKKINCPSCCETIDSKKEKVYYHQVFTGVIAHPDNKQVIPLCPEMISKSDGSEKNDAERWAMQRFLIKFKKEHPKLKVTIVADALFANAPCVNEIKDYGYHFIINAKPEGNRSLFKRINQLEMQSKNIQIEKNSYNFRYVNKVLLNDTKDAPEVNFLECKATEVKGKKTKIITFTWITDHEITDDNVYLLMRGGRSRWKVENETFNTLKNQGYELEHNFGHGNKYLLSIFIFLMLLAFLIDQIQEEECKLFQAAHKKTISLRSLWEKMRCYFYVCKLNTWEELFNAVIQDISFIFKYNTS